MQLTTAVFTALLFVSVCVCRFGGRFPCVCSFTLRLPLGASALREYFFNLFYFLKEQHKRDPASFSRCHSACAFLDAVVPWRQQMATVVASRVWALNTLRQLLWIVHVLIAGI